MAVSTKSGWLLGLGLALHAAGAGAVYACGDLRPPWAVEPDSSRPHPVYQVDVIESVAGHSRSEWADYRRSLLESLRGSSVPRDWALAAVLDARSELAGAEASDLQRAVLAAPDDELVQWLAATSPVASASGALANLERLEPDNAAVWLIVLNAAARDDDDAGISFALSQMATSRSFNGHYSGVVQALRAAHEVVPVPNGLFETQPDDERRRLLQALPVTTAMNEAAAVVAPAFQRLLDACRIDPQTARNAARADDCAATGRLLVAHGDTYLASRMGSALLRVSRTYLDEDVQAARTADWIFTKYSELHFPVPGNEHPIDAMNTYVADWIETGRELEAMRRALRRENKASVPPSKWNGQVPSFSEERLRADARFFEQAQAAN